MLCQAEGHTEPDTQQAAMDHAGNTSAKRKQLLDDLKRSANKALKVVDVRTSSSANQEFMTAQMTVISASSASGGVGNARLLLTGVVTDVKYGEIGEVFNAISTSPPSVIATAKVDNPAGRNAKEKKQMPMAMNFKGAVLTIGGNKCSTFIKNDGAVQSPSDVPPGTKVVLSGVNTGSYGKFDSPTEGGQMILSFTDIIIKDTCQSVSEAIRRIAEAMDTSHFSKWQAFECLPAFGDLSHVLAANPPLGKCIEAHLGVFRKALSEGLRKKVSTNGTDLLEVKVDGIESTYNLFPDGGETFASRADMLDTLPDLVFSELHGNGRNAYVPLLQMAVAPGEESPPQIVSLITDEITYKSPFFVEPRIRQVHVQGNYVTILFSLFLASTEEGLVEVSTPYIESAGIAGGTNKSLIQLGNIFGTHLRDKAVMATDLLQYASLVMVPRITKVDPHTDQFSFKDLPFSEGFVVDVPATLKVASALVSVEWVKANVLKGGMHVEYKIGNSPEDNAKKLQKRDTHSKEIIISTPPTLSLATNGYIAITESTTVFDTLMEEVPDKKRAEFRVVYPRVVEDIKAKNQFHAEADAGTKVASPSNDIEHGEAIVDEWLKSCADVNSKRLKIMADALVYCVLVDAALDDCE